MFHRILFLCTGNICRSPMAEALLRDQLSDKRLDVASAGTSALIGYPADPTAIELMQTRGVDITEHRARQATAPLLAGSDLILTMDKSHYEWVNQRYPHLRGRVHPLGRWRKLEIADPYRRPREAFEAACVSIEQCVGDWLPRLKS